MGALKDGHSIFDVGAQGLKSRVELEKDGSDLSPKQAEQRGRFNVEMTDRSRKLAQDVHAAIEAVRTAPPPEQLNKRKGLLQPTEREKLIKVIQKAADSIKALERSDDRDNQNLANELATELAVTIATTDNVSSWANEVVVARKKARKSFFN